MPTWRSACFYTQDRRLTTYMKGHIYERKSENQSSKKQGIIKKHKESILLLKKKDCRITQITHPKHICSTQHQQFPILHNRFQENIDIIRLRFHSSLSQSICWLPQSHPLPHTGFSAQLTSSFWQQYLSRKTIMLGGRGWGG